MHTIILMQIGNTFPLPIPLLCPRFTFVSVQEYIKQDKE
jgi:hypothetical protein